MPPRLRRPAPARTTPRPALPAAHLRPSRAARAPQAVPPLSASERARAALDCALAALVLIPGLPVMLVCALLVRLTSRGPAIYAQTRVGRGGTVFTLYKIRTMYHDCERLTGPQWSKPGDSRITRIGRVLRALHLDELPQLWNVLKGDMALVGPRPERPEIVAKLREQVVGYDRRHAVRPGITGFAQVHLPPDSCLRTVRNKLAYDLFYIRNRGARMALFVLFATGLKVLGLKRFYVRPPRYSA